MLGRTLVPLTFNDGEREIVVKDLRTLKEVFKREFYTQLVAHLHNKRLERFFFALGMDEIKETIENLKNSGKSDLEVINKVAELIGVKPISVELSESVNFARRSNLLEELSDKDQELSLVLSSYFLRAPELELEGSKAFRRETAGNTELAIATPKLKGSRKLVFENLIMVIESEVVLEGFEKVEFRNVKLKSEKPVKFVNTSVELYGCDVVGCLHVENTRLSAESSEFHDSNLSAIYSVGSSVVLRGCKIAKNKGGEEHGAQLRLSNSEVELLDCEIARSERAGLLSISSRVYMASCKVYENDIGISAENGTNIEIESCDIYKNGAEHPQVYIWNSAASVRNSQIHNSNGGNGLGTLNSKVSLIGCKIYENSGNGMSAQEKTELNMKGCDIYANGISDGTTNYPQVWIGNSTAYVRDSQIHNSKGTTDGLYMLNSKASLLKCKIYENNGNGIRAHEKTELNMRGCDIYRNGISDSTKNYLQIWIENSTAYVRDSKIHNSKGITTSINISNSKCSLVGCKIYENKGNGIVTEKTKLNIEDCVIFRNGGRIQKQKRESTIFSYYYFFDTSTYYLQIYVEDSGVVIDESEIYESEEEGIYIESGGVLLRNVRTYKNKRGVYKERKASLAMHDCDIQDGVYRA